MSSENTYNEVMNQYDGLLKKLEENFHPESLAQAERTYSRLLDFNEITTDQILERKSKLVEIIKLHDPQLAKEIFKKLPKRQSKHF